MKKLFKFVDGNDSTVKISKGTKVFHTVEQAEDHFIESYETTDKKTIGLYVIEPKETCTINGQPVTNKLATGKLERYIKKNFGG